jgi:hypothetical protein
MAMPKKPKALRELQGTIKDHPGRQNKDQPDPEGGIGPAPEYFNEAEKKCWDYLVSCMFKNVMGKSDRPSMELMARLFYRFRFGTYEEGAMIIPLNGAELSRLDSLIGRYGMTPSDRTKITVPKESNVNPFELI